MVKTKILAKLLFFSKLPIRVGCDPTRATTPAIIFFPLRQATLCCGIAGIVAFAKGKATGNPPPDQIVEAGLAAARTHNLRALRAHLFPVAEYLNGKGCLHALEDAVNELKRDIPYAEVFTDPRRAERLAAVAADLKDLLAAEEAEINEAAGLFPSHDLELINSRLTILRDIVWSLEKDLLDNTEKIAHLGGAERLSAFAVNALCRYKKLNFILNCLDRLEVRGRDSAGLDLHLTVPDGRTYGKILSRIRSQGLGDEFAQRTRPGDLMNNSITLSDQNGGQTTDTAGPLTVSFTYKTFSVIGALGRNVRELRRTIAADGVLKEFVAAADGGDILLAHTRWASVGSITEENCHPVNNFTLNEMGDRKHYPYYGRGGWNIAVVLNGDIDNYEELRRVIEKNGERIAPAVTTDTKIIPLVIEEHLRQGCDLTEAFRRAVSSFEGSHAIAMTSNCEPGRVFLALRGSGQAMYVGLTPDAYLFSSELYGLVEGTSRFIKMDGEKASPVNPDIHGQIFILSGDGEGLSSITACYYDGTPLCL
ncbi:MAG: hypothetical protein N2Z74_03550, partial [Syntrophales bacterium]|nr:hypothetical protein [Syntrophales bacterium]